VIGATALGDQRDDEDERHHRGRSEAKVGPLLGAQLAQLPAVDGKDAGVHAAPSRAFSGCSLSPAPSSSVSLKKRSSRVAWRGLNSSISAPDSASASESELTASSLSALNVSPARGAMWTSSIPACASATLWARSSSVVRRREPLPAWRRSSARDPW